MNCQKRQFSEKKEEVKDEEPMTEYDRLMAEKEKE
jgi:hypothetical protein